MLKSHVHRTRFVSWNRTSDLNLPNKPIGDDLPHKIGFLPDKPVRDLPDKPVRDRWGQKISAFPR